MLRSYSIGHFTEIVRDENSFVGCSGVEFAGKNTWNYQITCNYATNNFYGERVYETGKECSACLTGCHEEYTALCSEDEFYRLD